MEHIAGAWVYLLVSRASPPWPLLEEEEQAMHLPPPLWKEGPEQGSEVLEPEHCLYWQLE